MIKRLTNIKINMNKFFQTIRSLYAVLLFFLLSISGKGFAQSFTVGNLNYSVNDDGLTVTVTGHVDGTNASGTLIIPDSVTFAETSYRVTKIDDFAFYDCAGFNGSLTIGKFVTTIGRAAFYGCKGFNGSLSLDESVSTIKNEAFRGCSGFNGSLVIGDLVTTIGNDAFGFCYRFNGPLIIGNSVTTIGDHAFSDCYGFDTLTLGSSVTTIDDYAFAHCSGFKGSLTIGDSVTTIGEGAFYECSGFDGSLTIGSSVVSIGNHAFYNNCGFTGNLVIPNSVTDIGQRAFKYCVGFDGLTMGGSVSTIGNYAFSSCYGFAGELFIPNSVIVIGAFAFEDCAGLDSLLSIGNSVTTIKQGAFFECRFDSIVSLAETPPTLEDMTFYGVPGVTLTVPCGCVSAYETSAWHDHYISFLDDCASLTEDDEQAVPVYPNPTSGIILIKAEGLRRVSIFNTIGQQVYDGQADGNVFEYDLSNHEAGIYLIQIETASGFATKRVVLSK